LLVQRNCFMYQCLNMIRLTRPEIHYTLKKIFELKTLWNCTLACFRTCLW